MSEFYQNLSHSRWDCKYHVVFVPERRRQVTDVQQISVVALPAGRRTEVFEAIERVVERVETGAPALVTERRIGDDVVKGLERVAVLKLWIGQRRSP
jgi:REP element-mobilizing transposase RayT